MMSSNKKSKTQKTPDMKKISKEIFSKYGKALKDLAAYDKK